MPLVLFVGHPASGKTRRATHLAAHLKRHLSPHKPTAASTDDQKHAIPAAGSAEAAVSNLSLLSPPPPAFSTSPTDDEKQHNGPSLLSPSEGAPVSGPAAIALPSFSPSAPSSSRAAVAAHAPSRSPVQEIVLINLESLQLRRAEVYASAHNEKAARSALRAAVERLLTSSRLLIIDDLNAIKGFRYELWCRAREVATTYCVVYVDARSETCRHWNLQRPEADRYSEAAMTDLLQRMEAPNGSKRWDAPLFSVTEDEHTPVDDITQWLLHGKSQTPGLATLSSSQGDASYLQRLERVVSAVNAEVVRLQQSGLVHVGDQVTVLKGQGGSAVRLRLVRSIHYAELKRVQAQYVKMARDTPIHRDDDIARSYTAHLQNALEY